MKGQEQTRYGLRMASPAMPSAEGREIRYRPIKIRAGAVFPPQESEARSRGQTPQTIPRVQGILGGVNRISESTNETVSVHTAKLRAGTYARKLITDAPTAQPRRGPVRQVHAIGSGGDQETTPHTRKQPQGGEPAGVSRTKENRHGLPAVSPSASGELDRTGTRM